MRFQRSALSILVAACMVTSTGAPMFANIDQCDGKPCPVRDSLGQVTTLSQAGARTGDAAESKIAADVAFGEGRDVAAVRAAASEASAPVVPGAPTLTAAEPVIPNPGKDEKGTPTPTENKGGINQEMLMFAAGGLLGAAAGLTKLAMGFGLMGPLGLALGGALVGVGAMYLNLKKGDTYGMLGAVLGGIIGAVALSAVFGPFVGPFFGALLGTTLGGAAGAFLGNFLGGLLGGGKSGGLFSGLFGKSN